MKAAFHRVAFLLLLALVSSAQAQQGGTGHSSQPQPQAHAASQIQSSVSQGYRIAGTLINAITQQPLVGASVAIAPAGNNDDTERISQTATTSGDGHFAFTGLSRGKYSLMAAARGFTLQYFEHHDAYATAIAVGPELDSEHLVFRLEPDAAIDGEISDDNGDPVQTAQVRLFQRNTAEAQGRIVPMEQTQSDDQGHYHIGHLAPGTYYLAVSARPWYAQNNRFRLRRNFSAAGSGNLAAQEAASLDVAYPLTFYPDSPDSAAASPILLHAGERATANVVLRPLPALHVRIHTGNSANDGSLARAIFPAVSQRIFEGYLDPVYNAPVSWTQAGVLDISGLPPGHYVIEMPPGNNANSKSGSGGWYQEIDLVSDTEITAADSAGFSTVGGVVTFEGPPRVPAGASMQLRNRETGETFSTGISKNGSFTFQNNQVRPGRYNLVLETPQRFFLSRLSVSGAHIVGRTLEVSTAAKVHIVATASRGVATVTGVALQDDHPYAGAMIVLVPQDPGNNTPLFRRDQSDSDGSFALPNVVPGQYTLLALSNGWSVEWGNPAALQPYLKAGVPVQVTGDGELQTKVPVQ
jgi:hypothetical protein